MDLDWVLNLDEALMKDKIGHDWKNPESYNHLDGS
jgi:galactonate dehydratase